MESESKQTSSPRKVRHTVPLDAHTPVNPVANDKSIYSLLVKVALGVFPEVLFNNSFNDVKVEGMIPYKCKVCHPGNDLIGG